MLFLYSDLHSFACFFVEGAFFEDVTFVIAGSSTCEGDGEFDE